MYCSKQIKVLLIVLAFCFASNTVLAESIVYKGRILLFYEDYSIEKAKQYDNNSLPNNAVGSYMGYAVYPWNGRGRQFVDALAYIRHVESNDGFLIMNSISYTCQSYLDYNCDPLGALPVFVKKTSTPYKFIATIPNMREWLLANQILANSKDVVKYENRFVENNKLRIVTNVPIK